MANLEKRGRGWRIRWRQIEDGREVNKSLQLQGLKSDAEAVRQEITNAVKLRGWWAPEGPPPPPAEPLTPATTMVEYLLDAERRLSPRTARRYAGMLQAFREWMEAQELTHADLTRSLLTRYEAHLRGPTGRHGRPRSEETATKHLEAVELWWAWAYDRAEEEGWEGIPSPRRLQKPRRIRRRPKAPTWDEMDRCIAACQVDWHRRVALIARYLGLRRSECLLLEWHDFDDDLSAVEIPPEITKGGSGGRRVPIPAGLKAELAGWGVREGPVVNAPEQERASARGSGNRGAIDKHLRRAWKRARVRPAVWKGQPVHAFRKGLRSGLVAAEVPEIVIDWYIGHQNAGTGARDYTDPDVATWHRLVKAVAKIPPHSEVEVRPISRRQLSSHKSSH